MPPQSAISSEGIIQQKSRRRSFEDGTVWALVATLVLAMVVVTPFTSIALLSTKTFILAAGAVLTLVFYILARLSRGNIVLPPFLLVGALWLPVIAYALSSVFSGAPFAIALWGSSLEADTLGFMLIAASLGTLAALAIRTPEQYKSFLRAAGRLFMVIGIVEILIVIVGQFSPNTVAPSFSVVGSFEDLGFLMGLGVIGSLITYRFLEISSRGTKVQLVSTALALVLLALTNSPFVWVVLALVSFGLFIESVMMRGHGVGDMDLDNIDVISEPSSESGAVKRPLLLPITVLAVSLFFLVGGTLGTALANSLHVNVLSVSPSWQSTFATAKQTYAVSPVFGSGPSTFGVEWLKYRDPSLNATVFWNSDFSSGIGFIPTSLVTTGLVGVIAWLAFLVLFMVFGIRMLVARTPRDSYVQYVAILSFVATLYLFAAAIFRLPSTLILVLAFVFAGLFASTMRYATHAHQRGIIFSRSPRIGFVIVFTLTLVLLSSVVVAYSLVERYIAIAALTNANTAFTAGKLDQADKAVQNAISFAPSPTAYQAQANIAIVRLGQIAASTTMPLATAQQTFQATLSSGINAALTSTRLEPSNYQNWLALGNLYAQAVPLNVSGAYDSAKTAYEKAKALNPTSPEILYVMAQLEMAHKDTKAAQADLKAAIVLKQDYVNAIFLLSQLEVQDGNVKDALDSALAAAYFAPNDANILFQVGVLRAATGDLPGAGQALSAAISVSPQFANARYFLAAVYAKQKNLPGALAQLQAVAALSNDNAKALATYITSLQAGKDPFPANLLSVTPAPVK